MADAAYDLDDLLPGQTDGAPSRCTGERRLWAAVLEDALRVARGEPATGIFGDRERERARAESLAWMRTLDETVGGFDGTCIRLGLDPEWMRQEFQRTAGVDLGEVVRGEASVANLRELVQTELEKIGPREFTIGDLAEKLPKLDRAAVGQQLRRLAEAGRLTVVKPGGPRVSAIYASPVAARPEPTRLADPKPARAARPKKQESPAVRKVYACPCPSCGEPFAAMSDVEDVNFDIVWNGRRFDGSAVEGQELRMSSCFTCRKFFVSFTVAAEVVARTATPVSGDTFEASSL